MMRAACVFLLLFGGCVKVQRTNRLEAQRAPAKEEATSSTIKPRDDVFSADGSSSPMVPSTTGGTKAAVARLGFPLKLSLERELHWGAGEPCAAASGLAVHKGVRYIVADDELELGVFRDNGLGERLPLIDDAALPEDTQARKKLKPDLESLVVIELNGAPNLLAVGSGSTAARNRVVMVPLDDDGPRMNERRVLDFGPLYETLRARVGELNIEGAATDGKILRLAQRGNGAGMNALVDVDLAALKGNVVDESALLGVQEIELPKTASGVPFTLTDLMALPGGRWVFTASAEDTTSTYADGEIAGSGVGLLDKGGKVQRFVVVDQLVKIEGVHAELRGKNLALELVTDADDPTKPARLFRGTLKL